MHILSTRDVLCCTLFSCCSWFCLRVCWQYSKSALQGDTSSNAAAFVFAPGVASLCSSVWFHKATSVFPLQKTTVKSAYPLWKHDNMCHNKADCSIPLSSTGAGSGSGAGTWIPAHTNAYAVWAQIQDWHLDFSALTPLKKQSYYVWLKQVKYSPLYC